MGLTKYNSLDTLFVTLGEKHNVSPSVVKKVYESVFSFIHKTIKELPELKNLSSKELDELDRSNFYISNFCRFFIDVERIKNKREYLAAR